MKKKQTARRKFVVFKVFIYLGIGVSLGLTAFQLTAIYLKHKGEDLADFVQDGTAGLFDGITLNSLYYQ